MPCFTLGFLEQLIVWLIVVGAIIACIKLLVPWVTTVTNMPVVGQVIMIILWAIVAIMVVYIIFGLLGCLVGAGPPFHTLRP
jgi:hypothetical protein